jgi:hypothetical protein
MFVGVASSLLAEATRSVARAEHPVLKPVRFYFVETVTGSLADRTESDEIPGLIDRYLCSALAATSGVKQQIFDLNIDCLVPGRGKSACRVFVVEEVTNATKPYVRVDGGGHGVGGG